MSCVMMGDEVIELRCIRIAIYEAGYAAPKSRDLSETYWNMTGEDVLELTKNHYVEYVL